MNLSVTSVATYLPSSNHNNHAAFLGTTSCPPDAPSLTPMQEASFRAHQAEEQSMDAAKRNVVWSVEEAVEPEDLDAEGDDDPDYIQLPDGSYEKIDGQKADLTPVGMRNESGEIVPLDVPMEVDETYFNGVAEVIPKCLNELVSPRPY